LIFLLAVPVYLLHVIIIPPVDGVVKILEGGGSCYESSPGLPCKFHEAPVGKRRGIPRRKSEHDPPVDTLLH
jgi:hypothetical protein